MQDIDNLIYELEDWRYWTNEVQVLVNGVKYKLNRSYLEDYSDGTFKVVLVGEDK